LYKVCAIIDLQPSGRRQTINDTGGRGAVSEGMLRQKGQGVWGREITTLKTLVRENIPGQMTFEQGLKGDRYTLC
jgi:hypothetical protein